jgi:hypothetical protein
MESYVINAEISLNQELKNLMVNSVRSGKLFIDIVLLITNASYFASMINCDKTVREILNF